MKKSTIKVDVKFATDELIDAITEVADAMEILANSRLSERALILLLRDATDLNLTQIKAVLHALPNLKNWYLK